MTLRAQTRKDGRAAYAGIPQDVLFALGSGYLASVAEAEVVFLILLGQYQFESNGGAAVGLKAEVFVERGLSRTAVFRALARLDSAGIVHRTPGRGRGNPSLYAVTDPGTWRKVPRAGTLSGRDQLRKGSAKGPARRDARVPADGTLSGIKGPTAELSQSPHVNSRRVTTSQPEKGTAQAPLSLSIPPASGATSDVAPDPEEREAVWNPPAVTPKRKSQPALRSVQDDTEGVG